MKGMLDAGKDTDVSSPPILSQTYSKREARDFQTLFRWIDLREKLSRIRQRVAE